MSEIIEAKLKSREELIIQQNKRIEALESELSARIQLSNSWDETETKANEKVQKLEEVCKDLIAASIHDNMCILNYWEAGEPTSDGGYREKYDGQWYQTKPVSEAPKCDCGLSDLISKATEILGKR